VSAALCDDTSVRAISILLTLEILMRLRMTLLAAAVLVVGSGAWRWHVSAAEPPKAGANAALVKRGDYLANEVARCGDCHTPRDARGELDQTRAMQGAPLWVRPARRGKDWEDKAPDITASGKAGDWSEEKMIRFLSTGKKSDPPMPAYRLTAEDARAVTAYLRSLPGKGKAGKKKDDD
jgi:mono/diheme cytochrome c family protein